VWICKCVPVNVVFFVADVLRFGSKLNLYKQQCYNYIFSRKCLFLHGSILGITLSLFCSYKDFILAMELKFH